MTSLYQYLLDTKSELLVRKREIETEVFEDEVALSHIIFAINKALEKMKKNKGED